MQTRAMQKNGILMF